VDYETICKQICMNVILTQSKIHKTADDMIPILKYTAEYL